MSAELIRERRRAKGLTQSQLAVLVGVDRKTVSRWETGESRPTNSHLLRLAAVLDVEPEGWA